MTTFLLIRHAAHDLLGKVLAGRMPGIPLNEDGRRQARQLGHDLRHQRLQALYSSPVQRCRETAEPIGNHLGMSVQIESEVQEIDFGDWTGATFAALHNDTSWKEWNARRSQGQPPRGETMGQAQRRFLSALEAWSTLHDGETIAVVSHGDLIRSVVLHCRDDSLDSILAFEIDPASVTMISWKASRPSVLLLNATGRQAAEMAPLAAAC